MSICHSTHRVGPPRPLLRIWHHPLGERVARVGELGMRSVSPTQRNPYGVTLQASPNPLSFGVDIRSIRHKGLRRLMIEGDRAGLPQAFVAKIEAILSFLQDAPGLGALRTVPSWRVHQLSGDRRGTWTLTVSRNWRVTFRVDAEGAVVDLDFEDYH